MEAFKYVDRSKVLGFIETRDYKKCKDLAEAAENPVVVLIGWYHILMFEHKFTVKMQWRLIS